MLGFIAPSNISLVDSSPQLKQLFDFERVRLDVGQTTQIFFPLNVQSLLLIREKHMSTIYLRGNPIQWSLF